MSNQTHKSQAKNIDDDARLATLRRHLDRDCVGRVFFHEADETEPIWARPSVGLVGCDANEMADLERVCLTLEPLLRKCGAEIPNDGSTADGRVLAWAFTILPTADGVNFRKMANPFKSIGLALDLFLAGAVAIGDPPTVDDDDVRILRALAKHFPHRRSGEQIEKDSGVSRKTIGKRLPDLCNGGWVIQPKGPRKGTAITDTGKSLLKLMDAQTTR